MRAHRDLEDMRCYLLNQEIENIPEGESKEMNDLSLKS